MGGGGASGHRAASFSHQVPKSIRGRLGRFLPKFLVVPFKRQFNEAVYWLTGAASERMRKISCLAAADRKLWFGHVPHRLVDPNIAFVWQDGKEQRSYG